MPLLHKLHSTTDIVSVKPIIVSQARCPPSSDTDTKAGDNERVAVRDERTQSSLPVGRMETLAYDKAAGDEAVQSDEGV